MKHRSGRIGLNAVLGSLLAHPYRRLIRRWNWKTALLSASFRGFLILEATIVSGGADAEEAVCIEVCYRTLTSGFYSAVIQAFRLAQPVWAASLIPMAIIPLASDGIEILVHGVSGNRQLHAIVAASLAFTSLSVLFELAAMRRGILVVGANSGSLMDDLRRLPRLPLDILRETIQLARATLPLRRRRHRRMIAIESQPEV